MNLKIDPNWLLKMSENDDGYYSVGGLYCRILELEKVAEIEEVEKSNDDNKRSLSA